MKENQQDTTSKPASIANVCTCLEYGHCWHTARQYCCECGIIVTPGPGEREGRLCYGRPTIRPGEVAGTPSEALVFELNT